MTVTADAPVLKTESTEQSFNIETERINALPLNFGARGPGSFRNPFTFVALMPGGNITDRNNIRVNGMPNVTFGIRLEGQDQTRPLDPNNSDMVAPSVEAVQEISVQTSNFQAEYGQVAGGLFNFHHPKRHQRAARQRLRILRQRTVSILRCSTWSESPRIRRFTRVLRRTDSESGARPGSTATPTTRIGSAVNQVRSAGHRPFVTPSSRRRPRITARPWSTRRVNSRPGADGRGSSCGLCIAPAGDRPTHLRSRQTWAFPQLCISARYGRGSRQTERTYAAGAIAFIFSGGVSLTLARNAPDKKPAGIAEMLRVFATKNCLGSIGVLLPVIFRHYWGLVWHHDNGCGLGRLVLWSGDPAEIGRVTFFARSAGHGYWPAHFWTGAECISADVALDLPLTAATGIVGTCETLVGQHRRTGVLSGM